MPLWLIYHPPSAFTSPTTKAAFARAVTDLYTSLPLPAFYVNVLFIPVAADSYYIGAVARPSPHSAANEPGPDSSVPFIRITIQNIARKIPNAEARDRFLGAVDNLLKPFIADQGYDWEYSIEETDRDLWKINGFVPPLPGSEGDKIWIEGNKAVEFEGKGRL